MADLNSSANEEGGADEESIVLELVFGNVTLRHFTLVCWIVGVLEIRFSIVLLRR